MSSDTLSVRRGHRTEAQGNKKSNRETHRNSKNRAKIIVNTETQDERNSNRTLRKNYKNQQETIK